MTLKPQKNIGFLFGASPCSKTSQRHKNNGIQPLSPSQISNCKNGCDQSWWLIISFYSRQFQGKSVPNPQNKQEQKKHICPVRAAKNESTLADQTILRF